MPKCALPPHLKNKTHSDWPWPMSYFKRSINAFGPRCGEGNKGYKPWPPRLVRGFNVTRWEWSDLEGNSNEIYIPAFQDKFITDEVYNEKQEAIFPNGIKKFLSLRNGWFPSIIPTRPEKGWLLTDPWHYAKWDQRPGWKKFYYRVGFRSDFECYYNFTPIPYIGRTPE